MPDPFCPPPPFYTAGGDEISIGHNVFVNQNCTFYDLGGHDIADDVKIAPNVSIITTGHPLEPSQRRAATIGKPIVIEKSVWIATGATIIGGVTVGENPVVAADSVATKDIPPKLLSEEIRRGSFFRLATTEGTPARGPKLRHYRKSPFMDNAPNDAEQEVYKGTASNLLSGYHAPGLNSL